MPGSQKILKDREAGVSVVTPGCTKPEPRQRRRVAGEGGKVKISARSVRPYFEFTFKNEIRISIEENVKNLGFH